MGGSIATRAADALRDLFAAKDHPVNLAVARIVVFALLLQLVLDQGVDRYARIPEVLRVPPDGWGPFFAWIPFDALTLRTAMWLSALLCTLALLGCLARGTAALATLLCCYTLAVPELFGAVNHGRQHLIWFGALLAASPCGDALSLDRWRARRRGEPAPGAAVGYALPLRAMWLLMGVIYLFPGLAKLSAGPAWFAAPNLELLLHEKWTLQHFVPLLRIDRVPGACRVAAVAVVAFELSFVVLVSLRRTRRLALLGGLAFHAANAVFLHIRFFPLMACYVVLVDWHGVFMRARARLGGRPAAEGKGVRPRGDRALAATAAVGGFLLLANAWCGASDFDSWPLTRYPKFSSIRTRPEARELLAVVESPDGARRQLHSGLRPLALRRILRTRDPEERRRKIEGIHLLLLRRGSALAPGERLRIYDLTRSTRPGDDGRVLRRELLLESSAPADAGAIAPPPA